MRSQALYCALKRCHSFWEMRTIHKSLANSMKLLSALLAADPCKLRSRYLKGELSSAFKSLDEIDASLRGKTM